MRIVRMIGILVLAAPLFAQGGAGGAQARKAGPAAGNAAGTGGRMVNPESVAARLMLATPEQRERALALLPPQRQAQIRKQLQWFDSLPKAQQDMQIRRLELFAGLPPDRQVTVRLQMQALAKLPVARRQLIRRALVLLQALPPDRRAVRMSGPAFRSRFSPEEQKIIEDLSDTWLLPPAPAVPK